MKLLYAYAVIERANNYCTQTLETNNGNWALNNATHYSIVVEVENAPAYPGKYYYNSQWWERIWSELDEHGEPVEGATFVDVEWTPGGEA